jgi:translation initiation factor 2A
VDRSGKSYYGETTLYLLSTNGSLDARVTLDKEGPIHDVSWSPSSRQFGVVYGYMPAKTTIFNDRGVAVHSFPLGPRNTITFSPTGRFVLVAGFGNLAGQIDVYDLEKDNRKVCTIESGNPSVCEWSPDSRYIMTATTSPRLRVDNGVKLWHVTGGLVYNEDMIELYTVLWRPATEENIEGGDPLTSVPAAHPSAAAFLSNVKTPSKPAGAYRPPGARGLATPLHFKREDEGGAAHIVSNGTQNVNTNGFGRPRRGVPGAELAEGNAQGGRSVPGAEPVNEDGSAKKNKKKRSKKNNQPDGKLEPEPNGGASLAPPPQEYGAGSGNEGRSPDRRGVAGGNQNGRGFRSRSRNNTGPRSRSNTQQGPRGQNGGPNGQQQHHQSGPPPNAPTEPAGSQNPNAKKIRSLQKKVRAIEDLEMRLAGGEKLEDTQLKKIYTKTSVLKELDSLGGES